MGALSLLFATGMPAYAQRLDSLESVKGLTVTPSLEGSYDDNIFRDDGIFAAKVDDFIVTPGLAVRFGKQLGTIDTQIAAESYYDHYTRTDGLDRVRLNFAGQASIPFAGRCMLQPFGRYRRQRADYGDITTTQPNLQRFSTLSLEVFCKQTGGFFPVASLVRNTTTNTTLYRGSDQTAWSYAGGIGYAQPAIGVATVYYMHTDSDRKALGFTNRVDRAGVTFNRAVVSSVTLNTDVHWLRVRSTDAFIPRYKGVGWNGSLTVRPGSGLLVQAQTKREIANDPLVQAGYSVNSTYGLLGQVSLFDTTKLTLTAQRENRTFKRDPLLVPSPINNDHQDMYVAELEHALTARITLTGTVTHVVRRTGLNSYNFDANIASLTIAAKF